MNNETFHDTPQDETFHDTPQDTYDRLAALYGESTSSAAVGGRIVKWVSIGAGTTTLTFFPPRDAFAASVSRSRTSYHQRIAERYAAELIDKLGVPHTYDEAVTLIAVAYLEGEIVQFKAARNSVRGDG